MKNSAVMIEPEREWTAEVNKSVAFEREFTEYLHANYCIRVRTSTEAIAIPLTALAIGEGSEVIVPAFTRFEVIEGIISAGAKPVLVDVSEYDGLLDVNKIEKRISNKTKAIIAVHLFGQACEMDQLHHIASTHGLELIEDCTESTGAKYKNEYTGNFGKAAAFSFSSLILDERTTAGNAIITNDEDVYKKCLKIISDQEATIPANSKNYTVKPEGENDIRLLSTNLKTIDVWNLRRRAIANDYRKKLKTVECLRENSYGTPNYSMFIVKSRERNRLLEFLKEKGIDGRINYSLLVKSLDRYAFLQTEKFANAELLDSRIICLPMNPELTNEDVENIILNVNMFR